MAYTSLTDSTDVTDTPAAPAERDILGELRDIEGRYNKETDATRRQALLDSYNRLNEYALKEHATAERDKFAETNPIQSAIRRPGEAAWGVYDWLGEGAAKLRDAVVPAVTPIFTGKPYDPTEITPPVTGRPSSGVTATPAPTDWAKIKSTLYPDSASGTGDTSAYVDPYVRDTTTLLADIKTHALPANVPTPTVTELAKKYDEFYKNNPYPKSNENPNSAMYNMFASMIHGPESSVAGAFARGAQAYGSTMENQRKERGAYDLARYADTAHRFGAGLGAEQLDAASLFASKMAPYSAVGASQKAQADVLAHAGTTAANFAATRERAAVEANKLKAAELARREGSPAYRVMQQAELSDTLSRIPGGADILESLKRMNKTSDHVALMNTIKDLAKAGVSQQDIAVVVAASNPELTTAQVVKLLMGKPK